MFTEVSQILLYLFAFLAMYVQVFLFVTFLENKHKLKTKKDFVIKEYPKVTIIVPCYNEQDTVSGTVHSLLGLNYPKDKIEIILVDDGSTDNTFEMLNSFKGTLNIKVFSKENGGKHTAINLGIKEASGEFIGGLDSDSFVHPESLKRIITFFLKDEETMAVCPSLIVHEPKNLLQHTQTAEYDMSVFTKKMLSFLGAIHVTPGPFSIYRKEVFNKIGVFRKAHNTEDQEIALRMQQNGLKIDHCVDAHVYTKTPDTVPKLHRQRLRWIYGFIKNAFDYKHMFFNQKYGLVGTLTIPAGLISISSVIVLLIYVISNFINFVYQKIQMWNLVGFNVGSFSLNFDWFFVSTKAVIFMSIILYAFVLASLLIGRKMLLGKWKIRFYDLSFIAVYQILAPFWLVRAVWNAIWSKESSWTYERRVINN